ncbi:MAG: DnaB-like helicase C-terminal domain-containing protein, partial [Victivallaceae bacterium]|nr:DnaB-like helicase C-terminal domain-containing protein [Victivallaceae bacterium]
MDSIFGGFQKGKLLVLSSRPSIGKTALTLNIVRNMLKSETSSRILYCSGELDETEVMARLLCLEAQISIMEIIDEMKPASAKKLADAVARLKGLPLWIHPCCGANVSDFAGQIHDFSSSHPIDLIVIDSLG